MSWVATRQDLARYGLTGAACASETRQATVADIPTCTFALPGHFFSGGEQIEFSTAGSGSVLPAGLSAIASYLVTPLTPASMRLFRITDSNGNPVTITDAGAGVLNVILDLGPTIDAIMAAESSFLIANAKAYAGPWSTPPGWAPMIVGDLAAARVAKLFRVASPQYSMDQLLEFRRQALVFCAVLAKGEKMDDGVGPVDADPLIAEEGAQLVAMHPSGPFQAPKTPAFRSLPDPGGDRV